MEKMLPITISILVLIILLIAPHQTTYDQPTAFIELLHQLSTNGGKKMTQKTVDHKSLEDLETFFKVLHGPDPIDSCQVVFTVDRNKNRQISTAILVFTKTNSGGTDNVWFYDMNADGYSLDDKRTLLDQENHETNNIPDIVKRWKSLDSEANRKRTESAQPTHGLNSMAPLGLISETFRVTTVILPVIPVAAIRPSMEGMMIPSCSAEA
jgi:hypothetical protein